MNVRLKNQQTDLQFSKSHIKIIKSLIKAVLALEGQHCDEVSVYLFDKTSISDLHEKYFQDPSPTDCISFPLDDEELSDYRILGDIFVCPCVAKEYAEKRDKSPYEETTLYIVHGLLHLLGYDDIDSIDRKKMRAAERKHMKNLKGLDFVLKDEVDGVD